MGLHFGPEATNLTAIRIEVPVDLINNWFKGAFGGAEGNETSVRSAAGLHKGTGSDNFSAVLIRTGGSGRFVGVRNCIMKGIKTSLALVPWDVERKQAFRFEEWPTLGEMWALALYPEENTFLWQMLEGKKGGLRGLKEWLWSHLNKWKRYCWTLSHCGILLYALEIFVCSWPKSNIVKTHRTSWVLNSQWQETTLKWCL